MRGESVAAGRGDLIIYRIMPANTDRDEQFLDQLATLKRYVGEGIRIQPSPRLSLENARRRGL